MLNKVVLFITVASTLMLAPLSGIASAAANPGFTSTYDFNTNLYGAHTFGVTGDGYVTGKFTGTSGPNETVVIIVEIQTCGFFGCNWDGQQVWSTCTKVFSIGVTVTCVFNTGNSNTLHRLDFSEQTGTQYLKGNVVVS